MKIYVAGPYGAQEWEKAEHDVCRTVHHNVREAIEVGIALIEKGHTPFIPHLSHFIQMEMEYPLPPAYWYSLDKEWLAVCDALFYMGSSYGADAELELAKELGLKVFTTLDEVSKGDT